LSQTFRALQADVAAHRDTSHADSPVVWGLQLLRSSGGSDNREMIIAGSDVPPSLRDLKDHQAASLGLPNEDYSWGDWLNTASEEQLTNFSQWYTQRLRTLADPESRAAFVDQVKTRFRERVEQGIDDGWIDARHLETLDERLATTNVRFFSPFGQMPEQFAGLATKGNEATVLLPTVAGENLSDHEFAHVFGGIDAQGMIDYFELRVGNVRSVVRQEAMADLCHLLDEGYVEHVTEALLNGHPDLIDPQGRLSAGVLESAGTSAEYRQSRHLLGVLLAGKDGVIQANDVRRVVDAMVDGDFASFAQMLNERWAGRDVMVDLLAAMESNRREAWRHPERAESYGTEVLVSRLLETLRSRGQAPAVAHEPGHGQFEPVRPPSPGNPFLPA
jgi:hypothetical protein